MIRDDPDWRLRDLPRMQVAPAVRWDEIPDRASPQLTEEERIRAGMRYALAHYDDPTSLWYAGGKET